MTLTGCALSNLLSARSLLSKGASKMLRATGHARMVRLCPCYGPLISRARAAAKKGTAEGAQEKGDHNMGA